MSRRDMRAIFEPFAAFLRTSDASRSSMPMIVMNMELKWKFRWPWMHHHKRVQLLKEALFPSVAVSLANLPKYLVSSFIMCTWLARNVKHGVSDFATSKWNAFFPCSRILSYALLS
jgi:hypothetical protein